MQEIGYVEGRDYVIEARWAESVPERLPALAEELVSLPVDLIFCIGGLLPPRAAKQATATIPIVFTNLEDPVGQGIVPNLAQPGANVTGMTGAPGQPMKRLELLREVVPSVARVVLFGNQNQPGFSTRLRQIREAAQTLGVNEIVPVGIDTIAELDGALDLISRLRPDALMVVQTFRFFGGNSVSLRKLLDFAVERRLPQSYDSPEFVRAGGLLSLGTNDQARWRIVARLVDRILRGANPGDLPVEFNATYDIVLNVSMAQKIGLTLPSNVASQVTEWIR
jgi:putative ABC transport system substrate-binding protein